MKLRVDPVSIKALFKCFLLEQTSPISPIVGQVVLVEWTQFCLELGDWDMSFFGSEDEAGSRQALQSWLSGVLVRWLLHYFRLSDERTSRAIFLSFLTWWTFFSFFELFFEPILFNKFMFSCWNAGFHLLKGLEVQSKHFHFFLSYNSM